MGMRADGGDNAHTTAAAHVGAAAEGKKAFCFRIAAPRASAWDSQCVDASAGSCERTIESPNVYREGLRTADRESLNQH